MLYTKEGKRRSESVIADKLEQGKKRVYRALLLVIRAKMESIESGIETMEQAFLSHLLLTDQSGNQATVYETLKPRIERLYDGTEQFDPGNLLPSPNSH